MCTKRCPTLSPLSNNPQYLSPSRTCLKREYPWKSSWNNSDHSLIFNQCEEEVYVSPRAKAMPWTSAWLPLHRSFHPSLASPRRLPSAPGRPDETLNLYPTLTNHNPEGPESAVLPRGGDRSVWAFTHWHFSVLERTVNARTDADREMMRSGRSHAWATRGLKTKLLVSNCFTLLTENERQVCLLCLVTHLKLASLCSFSRPYPTSFKCQSTSMKWFSIFRKIGTSSFFLGQSYMS